MFYARIAANEDWVAPNHQRTTGAMARSPEHLCQVRLLVPPTYDLSVTQSALCVRLGISLMRCTAQMCKMDLDALGTPGFETPPHSA
jgi:hypothetical protein